MSKIVETHTIEDNPDQVVAPVTADPRDPDSRNTAVRLIYIIGGTLLALLGLRVLLSLLGANTANAFANLIYSVTYPFVVPFFGLFGYEVEYGVSRLEIETIVAMVIYGLVIMLVARLATIDRPDRPVA